MKNTKKRGFTLLETVVAVYILSVVVVAGFTAAFISISSSIHAKNQVTAFYLAQDAFDYIRHQRDINVLDPNLGWLDGFGDCVGFSCKIDTSDGAISSISDDQGYLYLTDNGIFTHESGEGNTQTNFRRVISINEIAEYEAKVEIVVSWQQGANDRSFRSVSRIFNSVIK